MNRYCIDRWDKNKGLLKDALKKAKLSDLEYKDLLQLVVLYILNGGENERHESWDQNGITVIDNGDYQGTLLFLIPLNTYQPAENEYLMTFVNYGSCSGCDTLLSIQPYADEKVTEQTIKNYMTLCRDMVCNMIKPFNTGWRYDKDFKPIEEVESW